MKLLILSCLCSLLLLVSASSTYATSVAARLLRNGLVVAEYEQIQTAVNDALPGDRIQVLAGIHYENVLISGKHAPADNPIVLESIPGETAVLDGADPELQHPDNGRWTWDEELSAWIATVPWTGRTSRSLLTWASYMDGRLIATHHDQSFFLSAPRGDALWRTDETVHLRLEDGTDPNTLALNVGTREAMIQFENSSGWIVRNLNLRHGGYAGVHLNGSGVSDVTLQGLVIEDTFRGITTENYGGGGPSHRINILQCRILNNWNFDWAWKEGYRDSDSSSNDEVAPMRGSGMHLRVHDGTVAYCEVAGQWDGLQVQGRNLNIYRNVIHHIKDDMMELESNNSKDIQVFENIGFDVFVGFSLVSNKHGPIYIFRNFVRSSLHSRMYDDVYYYGYPLKFGNDWGPGAENIFIYHNTFMGGGRSMYVSSTSNAGSWENIEWVNNIFARTDQGPVGIEGMGTPAQGIHWEGNLFNRSVEISKLTAHNPAFAAAGELGNPYLTAPNGPYPDFSLTFDSDAIGAASTRPVDLAWPDTYTSAPGVLPDAGAMPFGADAFVAGSGQPLYWPWLGGSSQLEIYIVDDLVE